MQGEVCKSPAWNHCLEYEYQLREEALRRCFEEGYSTQAALWSAFADPKKKVADLERRVRSRSPKKRAIKGGSHSNQTYSNSNTLAVRDQPSGKGTKNKGGPQRQRSRQRRQRKEVKFLPHRRFVRILLHRRFTFQPRRNGNGGFGVVETVPRAVCRATGR